MKLRRRASRRPARTNGPSAAPRSCPATRRVPPAPPAWPRPDRLRPGATGGQTGGRPSRSARGMVGRLDAAGAAGASAGTPHSGDAGVCRGTAGPSSGSESRHGGAPGRRWGNGSPPGVPGGGWPASGEPVAPVRSYQAGRERPPEPRRCSRHWGHVRRRPSRPDRPSARRRGRRHRCPFAGGPP